MPGNPQTPRTDGGVACVVCAPSSPPPKHPTAMSGVQASITAQAGTSEHVTCLVGILLPIHHGVNEIALGAPSLLGETGRAASRTPRSLVACCAVSCGGAALPTQHPRVGRRDRRWQAWTSTRSPDVVELLSCASSSRGPS